MKDVRLAVDASQPHRPLVEVDGTNITRALSSYTLTQSVRGVPVLTVEVVIPTVEFQGKATVVVSDRCAEALVALGWTPPGGEL